jgi:hypothetical protein
VIVYCRDHGSDLCIVEMSSGRFAQLRSRDPRWRDRHAAMAQIEGRHNAVFNIGLPDWSRPTVEARGCRDCGPRELPVQDLLAAFAAGLPKIHV